METRSTGSRRLLRTFWLYSTATRSLPVVNMLRVYASDPRHPRRYLLIDGYDTVKLLHHFGYIA